MATDGLPIVQFNVRFAVSKQLLPLIVLKLFSGQLSTEGLHLRNNFQPLNSANAFQWTTFSAYSNLINKQR
jgi:hypothetical protein